MSSLFLIDTNKSTKAGVGGKFRERISLSALVNAYQIIAVAEGVEVKGHTPCLLGIRLSPWG